MQSTRQLSLLTALATHGHFGRAAQSLGLSQPALTKALKAMEAEAGAALFHRGPPVMPTEIGEMVLRHGEAILSQATELRREIDLAKGLNTGSVAVAAGAHVADISVYRAVARLARAHPLLTCALEVSDHLTIIGGLLRGEYEVGVALVTEAEKREDLQIERLRSTPYCAFVGAKHPLARHPAPALEDMIHYPWLAPSGAASPLPIRPHGPLPFGTIEPDSGLVTTRLHLGTMAGIRQVVADGYVIASAPLALIAGDVARGEVVVLDTEYPGADLDYGFITVRGRTLSPGALAFMDHVRAVEAEI